MPALRTPFMLIRPLASATDCGLQELYEFQTAAARAVRLHKVKSITHGFVTDLNLSMQDQAETGHRPQESDRETAETTVGWIFTERFRRSGLPEAVCSSQAVMVSEYGRLAAAC